MPAAELPRGALSAREWGGEKDRSGKEIESWGKAESRAERKERAQQERTQCKGVKLSQEEQEGGRKVKKSYFPALLAEM